MDKVLTHKLAVRGRKRGDGSVKTSGIKKCLCMSVFWQLYLCDGDGERLRLSHCDGFWRCSYAWRKIWVTLIKMFQQLHKPAGEDTTNQAAIKVLSSAEWNAATRHFLTLRHRPIRRMLLKAVCSTLPWPDLQHPSAALELSSAYSCDLLVFLCIALHTIQHIVHFWTRLIR